MKIRPMTKEDCTIVAEIEAASFSMPWSLAAFEQSAEDERYCSLVAEHDGEILGYCMFIAVLDEAEIPNVCVAEAARKRGVGKQLMLALLKEAEKRGVSSLYLEVRKSNEAAQRLYHSVGFREIGIRKNFYEQPQEDALLMARISDRN